VGGGGLLWRGALHRAGQGRVEAAPAELARAEAHHRGRYPQRRAGAAGGHAAAAVAVGCDGMTRYAARSKRRTRYRYMNVWSGQLFVLRPEGVVYQLWHPLSHTDVRLAD